MKTLTSLIVGGALTFGTAMAQEAPKPAAPAAQTQTKDKTKVKKHRRHKKDAKTPAAPVSTAPAK